MYTITINSEIIALDFQYREKTILKDKYTIKKIDNVPVWYEHYEISNDDNSFYITKRDWVWSITG